MGFPLRDKITYGYPIKMKFTFFVRVVFSIFAQNGIYLKGLYISDKMQMTHILTQNGIAIPVHSTLVAVSLINYEH